MNYTKDQLLPLRACGSNTIYLAILPRGEKHPKHMMYDTSDLLDVPMKLYNGTAITHFV